MTVNRDELKRAAALRAIEEVEDGMALGLGTGSTAAFVVEGLARRVAAGLRVIGIPTSERTASQARRLGQHPWPPYCQPAAVRAAGPAYAVIMGNDG